jgi:hypothetical protein
MFMGPPQAKERVVAARSLHLEAASWPFRIRKSASSSVHVTFVERQQIFCRRTGRDGNRREQSSCCPKTPTGAAPEQSEAPINSASDRRATVPSVSHPLQFVLVALAGWFNQQQRDVIDYLLEENRVLREQIGARRLRLTDAVGSPHLAETSEAYASSDVRRDGVDAQCRTPLNRRPPLRQAPAMATLPPPVAFFLLCSYEPLGHSVGLRCATRRTNDFNPVASEYVVEPVGEFLIPIAN